MCRSSVYQLQHKSSRQNRTRTLTKGMHAMCVLDRHSSHRPLTDSTADICLMMDEIISITSSDDIVDPETQSANEQKRARLAARLARRTAAVSSDSTSSTASSLLESFHTPFKTLVAGTSSESRTLAQSLTLSLSLSQRLKG